MTENPHPQWCKYQGMCPKVGLAERWMCCPSSGSYQDCGSVDPYSLRLTLLPASLLASGWFPSWWWQLPALQGHHLVHV